MFKRKEKTVTEQADVGRKEIFGRVQKVIAERMEVEPEDITEDTLFGEDLRADELDIFEITMDLEEEFEIEIPPELSKWAAVKDVMDTLREYGIK